MSAAGIGALVGGIVGLTIAFTDTSNGKTKCAGYQLEKAFQFVFYPVGFAFAGMFFGAYIDKFIENKIAQATTKQLIVDAMNNGK